MPELEMMTTYRVWREEDGDDDAMQRSAWDPEKVATDQADHDYSNGDNDQRWPVTYIVEDVDAGKRWKIVVGVDYDPTFHTCSTEELPSKP